MDLVSLDFLLVKRKGRVAPKQMSTTWSYSFEFCTLSQWRGLMAFPSLKMFNKQELKLCEVEVRWGWISIKASSRCGLHVLETRDSLPQE